MNNTEFTIHKKTDQIPYPCILSDNDYEPCLTCPYLETCNL